MKQDGIDRKGIAESIFGKTDEKSERQEADEKNAGDSETTQTDSENSEEISEGDMAMKQSVSDMPEVIQEDDAGKEKRISDTSGNSSEIVIDPSVIKNKNAKSNTTSVTDREGIALFTNEYERNVAAAEAKKRQEKERLKSSLFIEQIDLPDKYEKLRENLFTGTTQQIIKETFEPESDNTMGIIGCTTVVTVIIVILIIFWFDRRSRKRRKNAADNYAI